jgi:hypothetical protein
VLVCNDGANLQTGFLNAIGPLKKRQIFLKLAVALSGNYALHLDYQ